MTISHCILNTKVDISACSPSPSVCLFVWLKSSEQFSLIFHTNVNVKTTESMLIRECAHQRVCSSESMLIRELAHQRACLTESLTDMVTQSVLSIFILYAHGSDVIAWFLMVSYVPWWSLMFHEGSSWSWAVYDGYSWSMFVLHCLCWFLMDTDVPWWLLMLP